MQKIQTYANDLLINDWEFNKMSERAFELQVNYNGIYAEFYKNLNWSNRKMQSINCYPYPFLPISFFKTKVIKTGKWDAEQVFSSSGTTGSKTSQHHILNIQDYKLNAQRAFEAVFGSIQNYAIVALLPSYFELENSSLLCMIEHFIKISQNEHSGFILNEIGRIDEIISDLKENEQLLLWGVSYALLDLLENHRFNYPSDIIVLETGGMKGKRKEMTKSALHTILKNEFDTPGIYSEYGMTELCSQAYSTGDGIFYPSKTMKIFVSEIDDPLTVKSCGRGVLNIVDLANIHSCCFIQTEDVGEVFEDGSFKIYGRLDNSQLRGCNLLYPI